MSEESQTSGSKSQVEALFDEADDEVKAVVGAVLRIESENLHMSRPRVLDDIVDAVRRFVQ